MHDIAGEIIAPVASSALGIRSETVLVVRNRVKHQVYIKLLLDR